MAKGLTPEQRACALLLMADRFDKPAYILMDHSRFDAHVGVALLKAIHRFYGRVVGRGRSELMGLCKFQLSGRGYTAGGIGYRHKGGRCSGDQDTGCGNSIDNFANIRSWLDMSGVDGEILLDGDDSVVVVEQADLSRLRDCKQHMLKLGMETEFEVVNDISKVEFCQAKVGLGRNGPTLIPNPLKYLSKTNVIAENIGVEMGRQTLRSTITGMLAVNASLPMMKPYSDWLRRNPGACRMKNDALYKIQSYGGEREKVFEWVEPSIEERLSFFKSWGVDPSTQIAFENEVTVLNQPWSGKEPKVRQPKADDDDDAEEWVDFDVEPLREHHIPGWWSCDEQFRAKWFGLISGV
jgi:hypothetical protein